VTEELLGLLQPLLAWNVPNLQPVRGVLQHRTVGKQREVLEDHADLPLAELA
jgi:hypothetical protein